MELIIRASLLGYENKELQQDFLKGRPQNVYKALIDEVMNNLVDRGIATREDEGTYFGEFEMQRYRRGPALTEERCHRVTGIGLGDPNTYDQFFPR